MATNEDRTRVKHDIDAIKASIEKYRAGTGELSPESVADLTKAIHDLSDHILNLHQRIKRIEESQPEWTTHGWNPPPGGDSSS